MKTHERLDVTVEKLPDDSLNIDIYHSDGLILDTFQFESGDIKEDAIKELVGLIQMLGNKCEYLEGK